MDKPQHVLVLGATGQTGSEVVKQALKKNSVVSAYVRSPDKITISDKNLHIIVGNVQNSKALAKAIQGQDAVIMALGPKKIKDAIITPATKAIINAMHEAKVKRLVMLSSFAAHPDFKPPFLMKLIWPMMKTVFEDKKVAENLLKKTDLEWTIIYATRLTNGEHSKNYHVSETLPENILSKSISRADVADFMLHSLEETNFVHKMPVISAK